MAAVAGLPFVVHVGEHGADEPDDGGCVGEEAHDAGSALISLLTRSSELVDQILDQLRGAEGGEGEHLGLGVVPQRADLGEPARELVTDLLPGRGDGAGGRVGRKMVWSTTATMSL